MNLSKMDLVKKRLYKYIDMKEKLELKETFPVKPYVIYNARLDSTEHSEMTGGEALCSNKKNGAFSAWDNYISGTNKSLKTNEEIVQSWRTTEFKNNDYPEMQRF